MTLFLVHLTQLGAAPGFTIDTLVVLCVVAVALLFFISEVVPIDVTAMGVMVTVILLEPWTNVGAADGLSGFSNPATLTVLAMFILSEGIRRTGVLSIIGDRIVGWTKGSVTGQYAAVVGLSGGTAGIINNPPRRGDDDSDGDEHRPQDENLSVEAAHAAIVRGHAGRDADADRDVHQYPGVGCLGAPDRPPVRHV